MAVWTTPDAVHSFCGEAVLHPAVDVKDDDTATYWKHEATCLHWIILDMGEFMAIKKIRLYQGATTGTRFGTNVGVTVYVGDDPADLGDAVWEGLMNVEGWQESGEFEKNGRYVKVVSKSNSDTQRMYEFDAYAESFWTTPNAVHSKCGEEVGREATRAIDDNTETDWTHYITCFHWIIFDMGETKTITKIRIYQDFVAGFRWGQTDGLYVYVSDNPADFGDAVWEGVLNAGGWQESGEFSKDGRYVKLVSKSSVDSQEMYEFDAYAPVIGWTGKISGVINPAKVMGVAVANIAKVKGVS